MDNQKPPDRQPPQEQQQPQVEKLDETVVELTIQSLLGKTLYVRVFTRMTVLDIKRRIYAYEVLATLAPNDQLGIPVKQQHLVWNSVELLDDVKISEYKIPNGATIQLIPAMRGGPINFRRVPVWDAFASELAQVLNDTDAPHLAGKKPVAVVVLHGGIELHFFQFLDDDADPSKHNHIPSDQSIDIKPGDTPEIRQKKEANAKTRATVQSLKQKMAVEKESKAKRRDRRTHPTPIADFNSEIQPRNSSGLLKPINISLPEEFQQPQQHSGSFHSKAFTATAAGKKLARPATKPTPGSEALANGQQPSSLLGSSTSSLWRRQRHAAPGSTVSGEELRKLTFSSGTVRAQISGSVFRTVSISHHSTSARNSLARLSRILSPSKLLVSKTKLAANAAKKSNFSNDELHCARCRRKIGITNSFQCRCEQWFCAKHRYPETHGCNTDFKSSGRKTLEKDNPKITPLKLPKI